MPNTEEVLGKINMLAQESNRLKTTNAINNV